MYMMKTLFHLDDNIHLSTGSINSDTKLARPDTETQYTYIFGKVTLTPTFSGLQSFCCLSS